MKKKNKKMGGKRPGAGRPETGINTVTISFSVHKDFKEPIRQLVKAKIKELKEEQSKQFLPNIKFVGFLTPQPPAKDAKGESVKQKKFAYIDTNTGEVKQSSKPISATVTLTKKNLGSDYLTKRRNDKLGLDKK